MPRDEVGRLVKNLDRRVGRIERILPTLATKKDFRRFATKQDLRRFATKKDLRRFATKDDLNELYERLHRQMRVLHEALVARMDQHLEVYAHHEERLAAHHTRLDGHDARLGDHDLRFAALERSRRPDSGREP